MFKNFKIKSLRRRIDRLDVEDAALVASINANRHFIDRLQQYPRSILSAVVGSEVKLARVRARRAQNQQELDLLLGK